MLFLRSLPFYEVFLPSRFPSPTIAPKLASMSTPDLGSTSLHVDHSIVRDMPFVEVNGEQAHIQVMRGRLDALQSILSQLTLVLDSVTETHSYLSGQVNDLEMYVAGLAPPTDARIGHDDSAATAAQTRATQTRSQSKSNFWSKLTFIRVSVMHPLALSRDLSHSIYSNGGLPATNTTAASYHRRFVHLPLLSAPHSTIMCPLCCVIAM